jgi:hypothetical protein
VPHVAAIDGDTLSTEFAAPSAQRLGAGGDGADHDRRVLGDTDAFELPGQVLPSDRDTDRSRVGRTRDVRTCAQGDDNFAVARKCVLARMFFARSARSVRAR